MSNSGKDPRADLPVGDDDPAERLDERLLVHAEYVLAVLGGFQMRRTTSDLLKEAALEIRRLLALLSEKATAPVCNPERDSVRAVTGLRLEVRSLLATLTAARWYVADHMEAQPNDDTRDVLARIDDALKAAVK